MKPHLKFSSEILSWVSQSSLLFLSALFLREVGPYHLSLVSPFWFFPFLPFQLSLGLQLPCGLLMTAMPFQHALCFHLTVQSLLLPPFSDIANSKSFWTSLTLLHEIYLWLRQAYDDLSDFRRGEIARHYLLACQPVQATRQCNQIWI